MSKQKHELVIYTHQQLMTDYNELQVRIKTHLFDLGDEKFKEKHLKPTNAEVDDMMRRVMEILKKENTPAVKHIKST